MKHILPIVAISLLITACSKEFSQEGQQAGGLVIDDEKGGLNFFLYTTGAEISINIYDGATQARVYERKKYYEYQVAAGDLKNYTEYTVELKFHSVSTPGTFDLMVEGFTASANTKKFRLTSIPMDSTDSGTTRQFLKLTRSNVRYTFIPY